MEKSSSIALPPPLAATPHQIHETPTRRIPEVHLDVDFITDVIAARLATSLLGHVLFLKNQVPLYVVFKLMVSVVLTLAFCMKSCGAARPYS